MEAPLLPRATRRGPWPKGFGCSEWISFLAGRALGLWATAIHSAPFSHGGGRGRGDGGGGIPAVRGVGPVSAAGGQGEAVPSTPALAHAPRGCPRSPTVLALGGPVPQELPPRGGSGLGLCGAEHPWSFAWALAGRGGYDRVLRLFSPFFWCVFRSNVLTEEGKVSGAAVATQTARM